VLHAELAREVARRDFAVALPAPPASLALAKGKQEWDKRQALREKQDQREAERAMRRYVKQARR